MSSFNLQYKKYQSLFENYAENYVAKMQTNPAVLGESISYSLLNGGKRIRPVLMLACAEVLGLSLDEVLPFALALEMIHTYSLIHDDLPAMDNDDFRRGKPSSHKAFGEANAILAGDGLLNEAYAICLAQAVKGENYITAGKVLNECAGIYGMIAGQSADIYYSERNIEVSEKELSYIYEHKTGKLLLVPIIIPCILNNNKNYAEFDRFGKLLGLLFQMTDDILDVTGSFDALGKSIGKDEIENKLTCVRLYGLEGAKIRAELCASECYSVLEMMNGNTEFLKELVDYVLNRSN